MPAVTLPEYLRSINASRARDINEIPLQNDNFDLFTLYLEGRAVGTHHYRADVLTLFFVFDGNVQVKTERQKLELTSGNILFVEQDQELNLSLLKDTLLIKFKFNPEVSFKSLLKKLAVNSKSEQQTIISLAELLKKDGYLLLRNTPLMSQTEHLIRAVDEYTRGGIFSDALTQLEFLSALALNLRNNELSAYAEDKTLSGKELNRVDFEIYMDENYKDLTLPEAAKHFGFAPTYFSTLVKKETGKGFKEQIDIRRMEEARRLLARPDLSLTDVRKAVGYTGKSAFYSKFMSYFGETPSVMRARLFKQQNIKLK